MSVIQKYLQKDPKVTTLLGGHFQNPVDRKRCVESAQQKGFTPAIVDVLLKQNSHRNLTTNLSRSLDAVRSNNAVAVITGQQVGLFLGPVFTLYKVLTAVSAARQLEKETGVRAVPIFWVQSEDHDIAEIDSAFIPDTQSHLLLLSTWGSQVSELQCSAEHALLGPQLEDCIRIINDNFSRFTAGQAYREKALNAYHAGATFSAAFTQLFEDILGEFGVLFFRPRTEEAARLSANIHARALEQFEHIQQALLARNKELESSKLETQVALKQDSPLSFFHSPDIAGVRTRLISRGHSWELERGKTQIAKSEALKMLQETPLRFSASALLRPIIQDMLFPTAAYISGPSEISYFAQTTALYSQFGITPPLFVPRASFLCLEDKSRKFLTDFGITDVELLSDSARVLATAKLRVLAGKHVAPADLLQRSQRQISEVFGELDNALSSVDSTLHGTVTKNEEKIRGILSTLTRKYADALLRSQSEVTERFEKLERLVFPNTVPQERVHCTAYYLFRYGPKFVSQIFEAIQPFEQLPEMKVIHLTLNS